MTQRSKSPTKLIYADELRAEHPIQSNVQRELKIILVDFTIFQINFNVLLLFFRFLNSTTLYRLMALLLYILIVYTEY